MIYSVYCLHLMCLLFLLLFMKAEFSR